MAMQRWNVAELELLAKQFEHVADAINAACKKMRSEKSVSVVLQGGTITAVYLSAIMRFAQAIEPEFLDQVTAEINGTMPRWKRNQLKVEAAAARRKAAKKRSKRNIAE